MTGQNHLSSARRGLTVLLAALLATAQMSVAQHAKRLTRHELDVKGVKIAYYTQGEGEPVVLIHGWLSSATINWGLPGTSALLAKEFKVIALDVRGHGLSHKPLQEEAYGLELVEDVVRILDALKIEKAHIVGYYMGGVIAAKFISSHPDRVLSGTLAGMGWLKAGSGAQWAFGQIGKRDAGARAQAVCGRSLARLALTEGELRAIRLPVLVLVGKEDDLIKRLYIEPLRKVRKDWPVVEIRGGSHINCIVKPEFKEAIAGWLRRNRA
jgi:pimeloyl-ACP methyl ester carboxylesterase